MRFRFLIRWQLKKTRLRRGGAGYRSSAFYCTGFISVPPSVSGVVLLPAAMAWNGGVESRSH